MEGESREHVEKIKTKVGYVEYDDSPIFQSTWVRRNTILADDSNWKSLARQFRYVCYGGIILWTIHFISISI